MCAVGHDVLNPHEAQPSTLLSVFEQIAAELTKLRAAEAALTSMAKGVPLEASGLLHPFEGSRAPDGD
ncbi:hypothetical protein EBB05_05690 [Methylobacterium brachiatum]|nr:hypothetical protein EBB05_05690 [Methylobacterium brachiatum]